MRGKMLKNANVCLCAHTVYVCVVKSVGITANSWTQAVMSGSPAHICSGVRFSRMETAQSTAA